jgi:hypothetical protein
MSTRPKALVLADALEELDVQFSHTGLCGEAADELRRLHEVNQELLEALKDLLDEAEWLRREYSHDRERDGWDALEEDPCFTAARAAIAKATGEKS